MQVPLDPPAVPGLFGGSGPLLIDDLRFDFSFETAFHEEQKTIVSLPPTVFDPQDALPITEIRTPLVLLKAQLDTLKPKVIQCTDNVLIQDLFSPLTPLVRWLEEERRQCMDSTAGDLSWQHRLLYQGRCYIPGAFLAGLSRVKGRLQLSRLPGFKAYHFYRRLVSNFEENWTSISPLLVTKASSANTSGIGVSAFLLSPFKLVSYRLSPDAVSEYHRQLSCPQNAPLPPWTALLGPATLDTLHLPTDMTLLKPPQTLTAMYTKHLEQTFKVPLLALSRIVLKSTHLPRRHPCLYHALLGAAQEKTLILISSQPSSLSPLTQSVSPLTAAQQTVSLRRDIILDKGYKDVIKRGDETETCRNHTETETCHDHTETETCHDHTETETCHDHTETDDADGESTVESQEQGPLCKLYYLLGGKDMLALDWLPFVSQALKVFTAIKLGTTEDTQQACRFDLAFVLYEYPGYGFKSGVASPESCTEAAIETLVEAANRFPKQTRISLSLVGYSLGSAIALRLARTFVDGSSPFNAKRLRLTSLTLLAPITRVAECAAYLLQIPKPLQHFTANALSRLQEPSVAWDTETDLKAFIDYIAQNIEAYSDLSMNIFHGDCDDMVSPALSRGLAEMARKRLGMHIQCNENKFGFRANLMHSLCDRIKYHNVTGASHLSLASNAKFTLSIHKSLFESKFVKLVSLNDSTLQTSQSTMTLL